MSLRYDFAMKVSAFSKIGVLTGIFDGAFPVKRISRRFAGIIREKIHKKRLKDDLRLCNTVKNSRKAYVIQETRDLTRKSLGKKQKRLGTGNDSVPEHSLLIL